MSIAQAERLKSELTDKYVVVADGVPELRRFVGLTGTVKTVNMSCRALVQFDGPVDISWYDIDPAYLKVVDAPLPKKSEAKPEAKAEAPKPAAEKPAGKSPLDAIRAAGAPKAAAPAAPAAAPAGGKPSPLDMIRKQVAGGAAPAQLQRNRHRPPRLLQPKFLPWMQSASRWQPSPALPLLRPPQLRPLPQPLLRQRPRRLLQRRLPCSRRAGSICSRSPQVHS